jgi:hypothetical protein
MRIDIVGTIILSLLLMVVCSLIGFWGIILIGVAALAYWYFNGQTWHRHTKSSSRKLDMKDWYKH